jgi:tRNA pseudouridine13 synthase
VTAQGEALPRAHGDAVLEGVFRAVPEDFVVEELDAFEPSGAGEHLLLTVRKRGMNTAHAAKRIATWAGVAESAIGYAGLKDRHALTTQRFSVWMPGRPAPDPTTLQAAAAEGADASGERIEVLHAAWHARKLPRGALAGNRFVLRLRDVQGDASEIDARLQAIAARGVPNYFGEQRFGRDGDNLGAALAMFRGRRMPREKRALLLSAARSALFNRVLARRVQDGSWDRGLDGEVWMLDGSRSVFGPEPPGDALAARVAGFDIHPTAPMWGRGELRTAAVVGDLERDALQDAEALALRAGLERAGLAQERRATRMRAAHLEWSRPEPDSLVLRFELPAGSYATCVLDEIGHLSAPRR